MKKKTSPHILNTSANLLGFCLFVITAIHVSDKQESLLIDEYTSIIALILAVSSLLSFSSMRITSKNKLGLQLENIADILFIVALIGIVILVLFFLVNYI